MLSRVEIFCIVLGVLLGLPIFAEGPEHSGDDSSSSEETVPGSNPDEAVSLGRINSLIEGPLVEKIALVLGCPASDDHNTNLWNYSQVLKYFQQELVKNLSAYVPASYPEELVKKLKEKTKFKELLNKKWKDQFKFANGGNDALHEMIAQGVMGVVNVMLVCRNKTHDDYNEAYCRACRESPTKLCVGFPDGGSGSSEIFQNGVAAIFKAPKEASGDEAQAPIDVLAGSAGEDKECKDDSKKTQLAFSEGEKAALANNTLLGQIRAKNDFPPEAEEGGEGGGSASSGGSGGAAGADGGASGAAGGSSGGAGEGAGGGGRDWQNAGSVEGGLFLPKDGFLDSVLGYYGADDSEFLQYNDISNIGQAGALSEYSVPVNIHTVEDSNRDWKAIAEMHGVSEERLKEINQDLPKAFDGLPSNNTRLQIPERHFSSQEGDTWQVLAARIKYELGDEYSPDLLRRLNNNEELPTSLTFVKLPRKVQMNYQQAAPE